MNLCKADFERRRAAMQVKRSIQLRWRVGPLGGQRSSRSGGAWGHVT